MREKSDVDALDDLCKYYGMPRPHGLGVSSEGDLSVLHQDPSNIRVINGVTGEVLQPPPPRIIRVANWMKSLISSNDVLL